MNVIPGQRSREDHVTLGLLVLLAAFVAVVATLIGSQRAAIRKLALAVVLVILWAALPSLGLQR